MRFLGAVSVFWGRLGWRVGCGGGRCWGQLVGSEMVVKKCRENTFFPDRCFLVRVRSRIDPVLVWCNLSVFDVVFDAIGRLLG